MDIKKEIFVPSAILPIILGRQDANLRMIESELNVKISVLGENVTVIASSNDEAYSVVKMIEHLVSIATDRELTGEDIACAVKMVIRKENDNISTVLSEKIKVGGRVKTVIAKSPSQKMYVEAMRKSDMVFGVGPAGTGKTYLAMAMAVNHFLEKKVMRIILARPAVEAGEKLGFLPGDIADKINPYLRPLYDALYSMMDIDYVGKLIEKGIIEVAPLAFMRGRTLNDSFVILDEAQNTTEEQMKMFLTRLGFNSKAVITGDVTQVDLPSDKRSGLITAINVLSHIDDIKFIKFSERDVVRHPLVSKIVKAYDAAIKFGDVK
ncbi:MAG: PhoH family protein [Deferribacterales bacterium]|nr:PhoH family protein [Deferribacterales bacterium]